MTSTSGPITVDDTHPDIGYSPRGLWKLNDICLACNVSTGGQGTLRKQAFNSTWHAAPGAQFDPKNGMSIDFAFTGSNAIAMFVLFRRTNQRGRTRDDGKSNLLLKLDSNSPQRLPLTLEGWTNQELRQQFRMAQFLVNSPQEGNHTLNIQLERNNAMDVPVTFALDYIRFTPASTNANTGGSAPRPSVTPDSTTFDVPEGTEVSSPTPTQPDDHHSLTASPSSETSSASPKPKSEIAKIAGPIAGLVLALVMLVTLLFCWRQRHVRKQRLKQSIRHFRPVMFDRWHDPPFSYYRPDSVEKPQAPATVLPLYRPEQREQAIEKPPLSRSPPPRRISIARASFDTDAPLVEPPPRRLTAVDRASYQRQSFLTESTFSAHPQSFVSSERKNPLSRRPFVSISSTIESLLADPPTRSPGLPSNRF